MSYSTRVAAAAHARLRLVLVAATLVVLAALGATLLVAKDASPTAEDLDCAERYARARTAADSARVDREFPVILGRGSGRASSRSLVTIACGARRESGTTQHRLAR